MICESHKMIAGTETSSIARMCDMWQPNQSGCSETNLFPHNRGLTEVFKNGYYSIPEVTSDAMTANLRVKERVCKESARALIRSQSQDYFQTCKQCWVFSVQMKDTLSGMRK